MNKSFLIIISHFAFWLFNVIVNIAFTNYSIATQTMSTLIFAIPFYINYFILVPHFLNKISFKSVFIWMLIYAAMHFFACYPLYKTFPNIFKSPGIVSDAIEIGAVIHISFYYIGFSTCSRLVFEWVKQNKTAHRLYLEKKKKEIDTLKLGMSFPLVNGVLEQLEKESNGSESIVKSISSLAKVLRFKLYRKEDDSIMLSDEVKIIEQYLILVNFHSGSSWEVKLSEDLWVEKGLAFLRVEQFIRYSKITKGILQLSVENEEIRIELKSQS